MPQLSSRRKAAKRSCRRPAPETKADSLLKDLSQSH